MKVALKHHVLTGILVVLLLVLYALFAYNLERQNFLQLIGLSTVLFLLSYIIFKRTTKEIWLLGVVAILVRFVFMPAIPNLSQDFYRFIWDGRLLIQGINPYLVTVQTYMESGEFPVAQAQKLFAGMGALNASHFTNYPPINQLFFAIAGWLFPKSIIGGAMTLRVIIIFADIGILYFGKKLLKSLKLNPKFIFLYVLNPFIILELTGNLHFEGVMLFFFVWALYLLQKKHLLLPAVLIGLSISVKLIPLLLLPIFLKYFRRDFVPEIESECQFEPFDCAQDTFSRESLEINSTVQNQTLLQQLKHIHFPKLIGFYITVITTVLLTFAPFFSSKFIANFSATIGLWFQNFEFNASVYYIIRWIGYQVLGWNIIGTVGKVLPIIVVLGVLLLSLLRRHQNIKQLATGLLFAISVYFLLSTTVHPWYVATPLVLCVFTKYRFPVLWSFTVFLTYSAYGDVFQEHLWLVALEYITVIGYALWEIFYKKEKHHVNILTKL